MATNYVGELIHEERFRRRWSFGDLSRACGAVTPKQTSRISQKLVVFERESVGDRELLLKVIKALDLDLVVIAELLHRQRVEELAEWNAWADEPVLVELHVRPFAGFWYRHPLPIEITTDEVQAIEYARQMTVGREELRVVLAIDRRRSLSFADGEIVAAMEATPNVTAIPFMSISGKHAVFEAD